MFKKELYYTLYLYYCILKLLFCFLQLYNFVIKSSMTYYVLKGINALWLYGAENTGAISVLWLVQDSVCQKQWFWVYSLTYCIR